MKTHPLNVSYLVVGLVFLGIAGSWALRQSDVIDSGDVQWILPMTLVVAGGIGLVAFVAKGLSRGRGGSPDEASGESGYEYHYDEPAYTTDLTSDIDAELDDSTKGEQS